jgi:hypothetical protein
MRGKVPVIRSKSEDLPVRTKLEMLSGKKQDV